MIDNLIRLLCMLSATTSGAAIAIFVIAFFADDMHSPFRSRGDFKCFTIVSIISGVAITGCWVFWKLLNYFFLQGHILQ